MKIVIVDDEPKIRNGLSKLLSSRPGFEIIGVFENAMEALEQLSVSYADVIITDIKMPEINGLDLINRIREKDENTKIIILSGYSDFSFAQRAIELGVTRYLTKPTNARELIGILEEIEKNIQKAKKLGYIVELHYVGVDSVDIAKSRVLDRVSKGGHGIPEKDIEKRYYESLRKLPCILKDCDLAVFYDNTEEFRRFAIYKNGILVRSSHMIPRWFINSGCI